MLCFLFNFLKCKKTQLQGEPMPKFSIFSHTGPRFQFFEAFFVAAPPSNKEERGENF